MRLPSSKLIGIIVLVAFMACRSSRGEVHRLDLKDSLAVANFITKEQTCDKIFYVEKHKQKFVEEVGFSRLILLDISKQVTFNFFVPYASGGMIQSTKHKMIALQEQLDTLKVKVGCYR